MTAAHRTLPFGTRVSVVNQRTGKQVIVRISDRGPFVRGRIIDLTPAGARAIGLSGLARVKGDGVVRCVSAPELIRRATERRGSMLFDSDAPTPFRCLFNAVRVLGGIEQAPERRWRIRSKSRMSRGGPSRDELARVSGRTGQHRYPHSRKARQANSGPAGAESNPTTDEGPHGLRCERWLASRVCRLTTETRVPNGRRPVRGRHGTRIHPQHHWQSYARAAFHRYRTQMHFPVCEAA